MHVGMTWQEYKTERQNAMDKVFAAAEATSREENDGHVCCCCTGECVGNFDIQWQTEEFPLWLSKYATPAALRELGVPEDDHCPDLDNDEVVLKDRILSPEVAEELKSFDFSELNNDN